RLAGAGSEWGQSGAVATASVQCWSNGRALSLLGWRPRARVCRRQAIPAPLAWRQPYLYPENHFTKGRQIDRYHANCTFWPLSRQTEAQFDGRGRIRFGQRDRRTETRKVPAKIALRHSTEGARMVVCQRRRSVVGGCSDSSRAD